MVNITIQIAQTQKMHLDLSSLSLQLIFNMLGEASTTKIARNKDALGFDENKHAAKEGGTVARKELEIRSGEKVVTQENYLHEPETKKRLESKKK